MRERVKVRVRVWELSCTRGATETDLLELELTRFQLEMAERVAGARGRIVDELEAIAGTDIVEEITGAEVSTDALENLDLVYFKTSFISFNRS